MEYAYDGNRNADLPLVGDDHSTPWENYEGYHYEGPEEEWDGHGEALSSQSSRPKADKHVKKSSSRKLLYQTTPSAVYPPPTADGMVITGNPGADDMGMQGSSQSTTSSKSKDGTNWGQDAMYATGAAAFSAAASYGAYRAVKACKKKKKESSSAGDVSMSKRDLMQDNEPMQKRSNHGGNYPITPSYGYSGTIASPYEYLPDYAHTSDVEGFHPHSSELSHDDKSRVYDEEQYWNDLPLPPFESFQPPEYDELKESHQVDDETYGMEKVTLDERKPKKSSSSRSKRTGRKLLQGVATPAPFDPSVTPAIQDPNGAPPVGGSTSPILGTPGMPEVPSGSGIGQTASSNSQSGYHQVPLPPDQGKSDLKKFLFVTGSILGGATVLTAAGCIYCNKCHQNHDASADCQAAVPTRAAMPTRSVEMQHPGGGRGVSGGRGGGRGGMGPPGSMPPRPMHPDGIRLGPMPPQGVMPPHRMQQGGRGMPPPQYY